MLRNFSVYTDPKRSGRPEAVITDAEFAPKEMLLCFVRCKVNKTSINVYDQFSCPIVSPIGAIRNGVFFFIGYFLFWIDDSVDIYVNKFT